MGRREKGRTDKSFSFYIFRRHLAIRLPGGGGGPEAKRRRKWREAEEGGGGLGREGEMEEEREGSS